MKKARHRKRSRGQKLTILLGFITVLVLVKVGYYWLRLIAECCEY